MARARKKHNPFYSAYQYHETGAKVPRFDIDVSVPHIKGYEVKKFKLKGTISSNAAQEWRRK